MPRARTKLYFFFSIVLLVAALTIAPADAAIQPAPAIDRILTLFRDNVSQWEATLRDAALKLFWLLAGIEFTWSCIKLGLKGSDLSEFVAELINRVLYIGFFLTLLLHSSEWAGYIVNSFRIAANNAGGAYLIDPSNILEMAIGIVSKLLHSTSIFNPVDAVISSLCAISILICFGLMAANMIEALIESYVVISAGVFFMGFGGSSWSNEYAKKLLTYAISIGAKLFLIQLIMGLCERIVSQLATEFDGSNLDDALVMVGIACVMWIVSLNVPNKLQGLINGTSFGAGGMIAGAVVAGIQAGTAVAATAANGALGGVSAYQGAGKLLAAKQEEAGRGPMPSSFAARVKEMAKYGQDNLGQRLRGETRFGNAGMQMGHAMNLDAEMIRTKTPGKPPSTTQRQSAQQDDVNAAPQNKISAI